MRRYIRIAVAIAAIVMLAGAAFAATGGEPTPLASSGVGDVSGPCDEAEHANDPRCTGPQRPEDDNAGLGDTTGFDDDGADDISGPCDEAEHANDPRCTGSQPADDNSGPGSGHDDDDNSGPGSGDDDDDNSGSGSGDDS